MRNISRGILGLSGGALLAVLVAAGPDAQTGPGADRGRAVFTAKQCDRCHAAAGDVGVGPGLQELRRPQGALELVGRLWNHVPAMWTTVSQQGFVWPEITLTEMTDLLAYLGADAARDPVPDPRKGQVVLMRKGCLKCHSLRQEGGAVRPDFAVRRPDYDSPAAWATTMWTHAPRMVQATTAQRVPYPRFSGDEMSHLLGFLRQASAEPGVSPGR